MRIVSYPLLKIPRRLIMMWMLALIWVLPKESMAGSQLTAIESGESASGKSIICHTLYDRFSVDIREDTLSIYPKLLPQAERLYVLLEEEEYAGVLAKRFKSGSLQLMINLDFNHITSPTENYILETHGARKHQFLTPLYCQWN